MSFHAFRSLRFVPGAAVLLTSAALFLSGCTGGAGTGSSSAPAASSDDHAHAHPTEGPHHGELVELGNEAYHAEIVHGEGGAVTVYILDSSAAKAVPIDAPEVAINLTHNGEAEQFKLAAAPDAGDPDGKASRFMLQDEHLAADLDAQGTVAKLVIVIDGTQFTGKIEHAHDAAGHEHAHESPTAK